MPTVVELRSELGKRKLPTDGLKGKLEQRLRDADRKVQKAGQREAKRKKGQREAKRMKTAMHSIVDEYLCPITQELPLDPVLAEDGRIYERWAIMEWLGKQQRSPSTGMAMGTMLVGSPQVRNTLETLVKSGTINGDKATAWKKKLKDDTKVKELRAKAEHDEAGAMYELGRAHSNGFFSLPEDEAKGRAWYERGAVLHDVKCMAKYGDYLMKGLGGEPIPTLGAVYTTRAAEGGSNLAAFQLGRAFEKGKYGLPRDTAHAKYWLGKVVDGSCPVKHLSNECVESAKKKLDSLSS